MYMHLICTHKSRKSTSYGIVLMLHHHVMAIVKNVKKIRFLLCYSIHKHLQQLLYIINMIKNINNRHIYDCTKIIRILAIFKITIKSGNNCNS